jgi:hypothetical protein
MPTMTPRYALPLLTLLLLLGAVAPPEKPAARHPKVVDLQAVFGPAGIDFEQRELTVDLNGDGHPEVLVLLADRRRGLKLPNDAATLTARGTTVDGFAVFDGAHPDIPIFFQYFDYDGIDLRLDKIGGQVSLVADGGRDHLQKVWGWRKYADGWPVDGWEARDRQWDVKSDSWVKNWRPLEKVSVFVGK